MQNSPIPQDELARQVVVDSMKIVDTVPEPRFDKITFAVKKRFEVPIVTLSILDHDREWFKSCVGTENKEGNRNVSFCGHVLFSKYIYIIEDTTKDDRFADNPAVIGKPFIRFYAGMTVRDRKTGQP